MFTQLFLAPDHLMLVRSNRFEERYQRFYFKDIQALVVTALPSRSWLQASMAVLAGTIFLLALTVVQNPAWRALLGMFGVLPATIGLVDYFRGQRCRMILKTAVSNEPLPAVSRMPAARLVISRLKPPIEQAQQGEWTPEMAPVTGPPVMAPTPPHVAPANRLLPALFALVSLDAIIYIVAKYSGRNELFYMLAYSVLTEIVIAIAALKRRGGDPRWVLYSLSGVVIACGALDIIGGIATLLYVGWTIGNARTTGGVGGFTALNGFYPQVFFWWAFGWRAAIAAAGWLSYFFKIEPVPATGSSPE